MTLVEFLLERLRWEHLELTRLTKEVTVELSSGTEGQCIGDYDPELELAKVEAKIKVVNLAAEWEVAAQDHRAHFARQAAAVLRQAISFLALPYTEYPEYKQEWRPQ